MYYNRKFTIGEETFTVLDLIYSHYDYKKNAWSMSKWIVTDDEREKLHAIRLYNFTQQIDDWRQKHNWNGTSEYIVTRYLSEYYDKEI